MRDNRASTDRHEGPGQTPGYISGSVSMDQNAPQNDTAAAADILNTSAATCRSLERAAVRDLQARKRAEYRQQNAEDSARIDHLRHERNARVDELDRQARATQAAYELAVGEQRTPWIDAHDETVVARRVSRAALAAARKDGNAADRAALEKLRVAHRAAQESFAAEASALTATREMAFCELRSAWNEARGRVGDAKRTMKARLKELRRANAAERPARTEAEAHARKERVVSSEARWDAARKANLVYAATTVELRDAERSHAPASRIEELRTLKHAQRLEAEHLEHEARAADLAVADALYTEQQRISSEAAFAKAQARDPWLDERQKSAIEKRKARSAMRDFRNESRSENQAAWDDLRARRNAESEAYENAVRAIYAARGARDAKLRDDYLEKRDRECHIRKQAKAAARAYAREHRGEHAAALECIRKQKVAAQEAFRQAVNTINCTRGVERAEERANVRSIANDILRSYQQARDATA